MTELEEIRRRIELKYQFMELLYIEKERARQDLIVLKTLARNLKNGKEENTAA